MTERIAKGTQVRIHTDNGGEIVTTLTSDFVPTYTVDIEAYPGFILAWRVERVEAEEPPDLTSPEELAWMERQDFWNPTTHGDMEVAAGRPLPHEGPAE
jgi:hypothetical protein